MVVAVGAQRETQQCGSKNTTATPHTLELGLCATIPYSVAVLGTNKRGRCNPGKATGDTEDTMNKGCGGLSFMIVRLSQRVRPIPFYF